MKINILLSIWLSFLCCSQSIAQNFTITNEMIEDARKNLQKSIESAIGNKEKSSTIYESALRKANTCPNNECAYESYASSSHDFANHLNPNRKCPISLHNLIGDWVNTKKWGNYEKISLSLYKGRPSVHQFITFRPQKINGLEDGFGGWRFETCKVMTIEHTSSGGRIFTPGNDLIILSYNPQSKVLLVFDGDHFAEYLKSN